MTSLTNIQISPVLRLYLDELTGERYPYAPDFGAEAQEQFWQAQLAQIGLGGLTSVKKGSELVRPATIPEAALQILLEWFLKRWYGEEDQSLSDIDWTKCLEEVGYPASFDGGVILTAGEQLIVAPQCCVGLQDHTGWSREAASTDFQHIWIGHPWMYYKTAGNQVLLTGLIEKELTGERWLHYESKDNDYLLDFSLFRAKAAEQIDAQDIKYSIARDEWQQAIRGLEAELTQFKQRLTELLASFVPAYAKKIANCLVDGNGEALSYDPEDW